MFTSVFLLALLLQGDDLHPVALESKVTHVQPMTGIVLWSDSEQNRTDAVQLEFSYMKYGDIVAQRGTYDWGPVERVLASVSGRRHQAILRFYDTYVGCKTTVPEYIRHLSDYHETTGLSEHKSTDFPDWSHPELKRFILEFYGRFSEKYDRDPRLAFVEAGFGLWAEYHIYDGPMKLGKTFPDFDYQEQFLKHLGSSFRRTPWLISVDAADREISPLASRKSLLGLGFGTFDDSFLCKQHAKENEPNWRFFGPDRHLAAPAGGEFSYYNDRDQKLALSEGGPNGVSFESAAQKFHITFMIGNDQPTYQSMDRLRSAGLACGYRFKMVEFRAGKGRSKVRVLNTGVAPIYQDAYVAVDGVRSKMSLKGLRSGEALEVEVEAAGRRVTIECDRLVSGQRVEFEADLKAP